ncbi:MAG: hypothetical protein HYX78_06480 [Armatimonadetes bacterium]|nr:hypothetical protein [Armatimonadota bacterium]
MRVVYIIALAVAVTTAHPLWAQEQQTELQQTSPAEQGQPAAAPPTVVQPLAPPPPPPTVSPDPVVFKRTPVIDGKIEPGEWDVHFKFDYGEIHAATYINWDDKNLYVASRTSAPTDLLVILDGNGDGWFHGSDNYEFVARRGIGGESPTLSVSRYESHGAPESDGAPLAAAKAEAFTMKSSCSESSCIYEIAIPVASAVGLSLQPGKKIGITIAVGVGDGDVQWIPSAPLGEVRPAELASVKSSASAPIKIAVKMLDDRLAPGEDLVAKISIKNEGDDASNADTIVVGGEGKTAKLLGSQLVRLEGIQPKRKFSFTFRTPIPGSAQPGSAALGSEVRVDGQCIASSLISFDIVPPHEVRLDLGSQTVKSGEYHRVAVIVKNNMRKDCHGSVTLSLPKGWQFRRSDGTRQFHIRQQDSEQAVVFHVKPPDKAEGRTPVLAEVQAGKAAYSVSGVLDIE